MLFKALALITLILIIFTPIDTFNNIETFYNPYKDSDSSILQGKYYKYTDKRDKRQFKKRRRTVRQIQTGKLRIDTEPTGGYYEANDYPFYNGSPFFNSGPGQPLFLGIFTMSNGREWKKQKNINYKIDMGKVLNPFTQRTYKPGIPIHI
jgi:hypothetical protein